MFMPKMKKREEGFTLIELLIVIAIIGALAAVVIPRLANKSGDARQKANLSNAKTIESAEEIYMTTYGTYVEGEIDSTNSTKLSIDAPEAINPQDSTVKGNFYVVSGQVYGVKKSGTMTPYAKLRVDGSFSN